ncbi:SDR family oxidoreductase [Nocardia sp. alder85J]|uniref:SDR family oxidoreductase n=1 Tax=Nocardia sp. alder85J TaxID=2862949 RepID=UPI001CD30952|nr:SDR family oxidoreductase [Nocardia sp. alder85J]MCX4093167.1 SDR family oxidoreductase [Nocardia sp. alder85J]
MAYLVTGASGCLGRYLVSELLKRSGDVHVLVRPDTASVDRFDRCAREWAAGERVRAVRGDPALPGLGIDPEWLAAHHGSIDHLFHLAAGPDAARPGACGHVVDVAHRLAAGVLHHVSTVAVAGAVTGLFTEDMFDVGQVLPTPYQRAAFEAERTVRDRCEVPWRSYRPSIVIGHSRTGEIDRIAGPYHFFRLLRKAAQLPRLLPLLVPQLGETNMVPVDFVSRALDHLAHRPAPSGTTYHLVDPRRQGATEVLNLFADEAGAPRLIEVMPKRILEPMLRTPGLGWALGHLGVPQEVLEHSEFDCWFDFRNTAAALAGTDIRVPPLAAYAPIVWKYWIENRW